MHEAYAVIRVVCGPLTSTTDPMAPHRLMDLHDVCAARMPRDAPLHALRNPARSRWAAGMRPHRIAIRSSRHQTNTTFLLLQ